MNVSILRSYFGNISRLLLVYVSIDASGVLTVFLFQHMVWDNDWYELAAEWVTAVIFAVALFLAL
ncbi:MAG: hypothetical protein C0183_20985 [Roseiflexus castenholzii]|nr:MAG: hypothetical protein C0183_20985 [Roseiflexus castenholzii]